MARTATRKPSSPADLDPVEASASPINDDPQLRGDAFYNRPGVSDSDRRHAAMVASGMSPEQAAAAMAKEQLAGIRLTDAEMRAQEQADYEAETARQEEAYAAERARFDPMGRPRLGAPLPGQNGRFQFRARGDGTEQVVDTGAAGRVDADFARWADEEPGSDRQRRYNPTGYAEWTAARDEERRARDAAEREKYGSAEGPDWRENITDDQWQARADRKESEMRQAESNKATRAKVQGTKTYQDYEAKQAQLEANRVRMQQNPFLTLGDPSLNEWQQFVLARGMLGPQAQVTDPNTVRATHNEQMNRLAELFARNPGMMGNTPPGMERAQERKNLDDAQADFDTWHSQNFGNAAPYYQGQRDSRVNYMMQRYKLSRPEAEAIADSRGMPVSLSRDGVTDGSAGAPTATPGRAAVPAPHSMNGLPPIGR